jgi:hypothetical protein
MPILFIYGVPAKTNNEKLLKLIDDCQCIVSGIPELNISGGQVSVFFPLDLVQEGLGEEIIVFIRGLYQKPERTETVIAKLANSIGSRIKHFYFPDAVVECFVETILSAYSWSSADS